METLIFLGGGIAVFWFLLLRPQQKRQREHQELMRSLQPGDEVVTGAGIHGAVVEVENAIVWLEVAPEVELKISREAIVGKISGAEGQGASDDDADEEQQEDA